MSLSPSTSLHQIYEQGFGDWSEDLLYIMQRIRNPGTVGEGAAVVPKIFGFVRVPYPQAFGILRTASYFGGTEFTLGWISPEDLGQIDHYAIYAIDLLSNNPNPTQVGQSPTSPCTVRVVSSHAGVVVFFIQTVLKNGYTNGLDFAPTCCGVTIAPAIGANDIVDNSITLAKLAHSTPGDLITYDLTGAPAYLNSGAADTLLSANGAGTLDTYKSWDQLYLTRNKSVNKSANFTVDFLSDVYLVDSSSGNITVTMPATSSRKTPITIVKTKPGYQVIINPAGGETINEETQLVLLFEDSAAHLLPVGTDWRVI